MDSNYLYNKTVKLLDSAAVPYDLIKISSGNEENFSGLNEDSYQEAKSLLLMVDNTPYVFVVNRFNKIDFNKIKFLTGSKKVDMATPEKINELMGVRIGFVSPFGNVVGIPVYFEKRLLDKNKIAFSAGVDGMIIAMSTTDCLKVINPKIADFIKN